LKQALPVPIAEELFVSLAKLEAVAVVAIVLLNCFALESEASVLSFLLLIFLHLSYSSSNSYSN